MKKIKKSKNFTRAKPKPWKKQKITNRFMFNKVFTNNSEACKRLLEILLGIPIAKISKPKGEYQIEGSGPENHTVRFDVYTKDRHHLYEIEMQTVVENDLPERARYYQGMMDVDSLKTGQPYTDLKDSIIIFICTFNPLKNAKPKPILIFKNIDIEDKETELNDRTTKFFFNVQEYAKITNNEELKGLLKFFCEDKPETEFTNSLNELVKIARKNERWRQEYMTYERWQYYERLHGKEEQKAEDEKRFAAITAEKDALLNSKDAEIAELKAQLAKALQK